LVGSRFEVTCGKPGHGGFVVARHQGVVVFVRHALPGERVVAEVTEGEEGDRFLRADAVEVLDASPDRVTPPCPFSGPGRCGGCDFQHVEPDAQRRLKAAVVAEQLQRLAGLDVAVTVEEVPGVAGGLGWRSRVQWAVDSSGRPGLRKHRSHDIVSVDHCRIAHPDLPVVLDTEWQEAASVEAIVSSTGQQLRLVTTQDGATFADGPLQLRERAGGRDWQVTGSGFWQVHPGAADTLVGAVLEALAPRPGDRVVDLYAGVGLFAGVVARAVGPSGRVVAVESDRAAADDAATNLLDLPNVTVECDRVQRVLRRLDGAELVVLDPPRTGAKRRVVRSIAALEPRAIAYVACDPAALARDVGYFADEGYRLTSLRAFDLFPMTHHVECVALLTHQ
jgi:tRNA/tmRNA/rRNA uracil-C5-methylase (TrmA/RlmC/RlmD family)